MKKLLLSFMIILCSNAINSQTPTSTPDPNAPEITFEKLKWEYPAQAYATEFQKEFVFKNTGKTPLIISNAQTSCGCDDCSFPKETIMPGKTGIIKYRYDTNRIGKFSKSFTVTSNSKTPSLCITVSGEVNPPPKEAEAVEAK
jgi:hypothetical protein